jgi:hypothetical protein
VQGRFQLLPCRAVPDRQIQSCCRAIPDRDLSLTEEATATSVPAPSQPHPPASTPSHATQLHHQSTGSTCLGRPIIYYILPMYNIISLSLFRCNTIKSACAFH